MAKISILPKFPERICWGCEQSCPANHLACRETRVAHPMELFGPGWFEESNAWFEESNPEPPLPIVEQRPSLA